MRITQSRRKNDGNGAGALQHGQQHTHTRININKMCINVAWLMVSRNTDTVFDFGGP